MSHHGREYEDDRNICGEACARAYRHAREAVALIAQVAQGKTLTRGEADQWLENRGYDCEAKRAQQREAERARLTAEIETAQAKLRAL